MTMLFTPNTPPTTLSLPFSHGRRAVPVQQIIRLEGEQNYTRCFFSNGSSLLVALTLKVLLSRLPSGALVRLHRKHAVNPDFIRDWHTREGFVRLHNGETLTIARRRTANCRNRPTDRPHPNSLGRRLLLRGLLGLFPLLSLLTTLSGPARAQTQANPVLVSTAADGGDGFGTIFQFTPPISGTLTPAVLTLTGTAGESPTTNQVTVYNNKLYGMTREGGTNDLGIIFVYDPATDQYTKLHDFDGPNGSVPVGSLTVYNNKLYGMTTNGGSSFSGGVIFVFDPATNVYTKLKDFTASLADGSNPNGALTVYNNKLYGLTRNGGSGSSFGVDGGGTLFEFDPATNTFTKKKDFILATDGGNPVSTLTVFGTKLYGTTSQGGSLGSGVLFEFDPATNTYTKRKEFSLNAPANSDGAVPTGSLAVFNNKLYGTTEFRGASGNGGTIYEFDPATNIFTKKLDIGALPGVNGSPRDLTLLGSELFGVNTADIIFSYNPATNAYATRKAYNFNNRLVEGSSVVRILTAYNNRLYGMTREGGAENEGVLYEFNPTGNVYSKKRDFQGSNGRTPLSGMVYYNGKLYGTTRTGGVNGAGVIYEYDPTTRQYTKRRDFSATDGSLPWRALLVHNCKLYGLTSEGGSGTGGVLFEYDPITNVYVKKHNFVSPFDINGGRPYSGLAVLNNKLYGVTYYGGNGGGSTANGVLFEYDLTTSTFTKRRDLVQATDGKDLAGRMTVFNNKLYGLMSAGGANSGGTLFEYDPATSTFTKKQDLGGTVGSGPTGGMIIQSNKLYGLTSSGSGVSVGGSLFEYDPVSNTIAARYSFSSAGNAAYSPIGSPVVFRGKIYGHTRLGGPNNAGTVFSYDPAIPGPSSYSTVFALAETTTGFYRSVNTTLYQPSPQLVVFPDCQLSATATVVSVSMCVNDQHAVSVAVTGQNCQPQYAWTADALSRLTNPANTSAISSTALQSGVRSFSVTVTESLCSVSTSTTAMAFDMTSVQPGNWNNPTTWNCGRIPIRLDIVKVRHAVAIPENYTANARQINFETTTARLQYGMQARMRLNMP